MLDATDSKSVGSNTMPVRVRPRAPVNQTTDTSYLFFLFMRIPIPFSIDPHCTHRLMRWHSHCLLFQASYIPASFFCKSFLKKENHHSNQWEIYPYSSIVLKVFLYLLLCLMQKMRAYWFRNSAYFSTCFMTAVFCCSSIIFSRIIAFSTWTCRFLAADSWLLSW